MINLRPYQIDAINACRESLRAGHKAPIIVAPTGSGKTICASEIIRAAEAKGKSTLFLAHRFELVSQASLKLASFDIAHNIIAPEQSVRQIKVEHFRAFNRSFVDHRSKTDIGTVQTKARRLETFKKSYDNLIIDECHLSIAPSYKKVIAAYPKAILVGLTASPTRLDGKGLGLHCGGLYDDLILLCQPQKLIDDGFLVPFRFFASPAPIQDVSSVKIVNGDYDQNKIAEIMNRPTITGDAIDHYRKLAHKRPAMIFCANIKHADDTALQFKSAGYNAVSVSGNSTAQERKAAIDGLSNGSVDVVCNAMLYIEGLDCPIISCIILLAHTQSLTRFMQSCGRGGRPYKNKEDCIVLDHVGNCLRHGFPSDDREWSLDGAKKRRKNEVAPVSVMRCHVCYAMFKNGSHCPQCGAAMVAGAVRREIKQVEGTLVEITPEQRKAQQIARRLDIRKCRTYEELLAYAEQQGYQYPSAWSRKQLSIREQYKSKRAQA
jgi:superfamily II DNA or RNA helicase